MLKLHPVGRALVDRSDGGGLSLYSKRTVTVQSICRFERSVLCRCGASPVINLTLKEALQTFLSPHSFTLVSVSKAVAALFA